jgi:hypothetical protein
MRWRQLPDAPRARNIIDVRRVETRGMPWTYAPQFSAVKNLELAALLAALRKRTTQPNQTGPGTIKALKPNRADKGKPRRG